MLRQILKFKEAILYVTIIFIGFVWLLMKIIPNITELVRTEKRIKTRTVELQKVTTKLEKIKKEAIENKKNVEERVKEFYKPEINFETNDMEYLLMVDDIVDMIKDSGVKIYALDYNYEVNSDDIVSQSGGKYMGCQLTLSLIGNYNQLKNLVIQFIKYPYLITINSIEIEPYEKDKKTLLSVIKITIYTEQ